MLYLHQTGIQNPPMSNTRKYGGVMDVVLRKYGNSTVAVLPPAVLKNLGLAAGQQMTLATNERGDIVLARKHRYRLSDLIAQCDPKAAPPSDIELWESAKPAGREIE